MEWAEVDLDAKLWVIPRGKAKSDRAHEVQLSEPVIALLRSLPRLGPNVFTGKSAIEKFILHDLRRTAASGMARLGIAPHVVDRILNHSSGVIRGVAAVYNRFEYQEERRAALAAWAFYVTSLLTRRPAGDVMPPRHNR